MVPHLLPSLRILLNNAMKVIIDVSLNLGKEGSLQLLALLQLQTGYSQPLVGQDLKLEVFLRL